MSEASKQLLQLDGPTVFDEDVKRTARFRLSRGEEMEEKRCRCIDQTPPPESVQKRCVGGENTEGLCANEGRRKLLFTEKG